jgi:hypothetical protein
MRKECRELTWGDVTILRTDAPEVLVLRYDWRGTSMVTLHNFSDRRQTVRLDLRTPDGDRLVDVHGDHHSRAEAPAFTASTWRAMGTAGSGSAPPTTRSTAPRSEAGRAGVPAGRRPLPPHRRRSPRPEIP